MKDKAGSNRPCLCLVRVMLDLECPLLGVKQTYLGFRLKSEFVKVFGCRPHDDGATHSGAGVRKPPREMLWGGGEDIASIVADVNRWSAPCRS